MDPLEACLHTLLPKKKKKWELTEKNTYATGLLKIMLESETRNHKEARKKLILSEPLGKIFITSPQSLNENTWGMICFRIQNFFILER